MAIKVIIHYPETEEGMKGLENRQAQAVLSILREQLSPKQLDTLMERLINERKA